MKKTTIIHKAVAPLSQKAVSSAQVAFILSKLAKNIMTVTEKVNKVNLFFWIGFATACVTPPKKGEKNYSIYLGDKLLWINYLHTFGLNPKDFPEPADIIGDIAEKLETFEIEDQEKLTQGIISLLTNLCIHEYGHVLVTPMQNFDFVLKILKSYKIDFSTFNMFEDIRQENLATRMTGHIFNWQEVLPLSELPLENQLGSLRKLAIYLLYRRGQLKDVGNGADLAALNSSLVCNGKPISELAQEVEIAYREILDMNEGVLEYYEELRDTLKLNKDLAEMVKNQSEKFEENLFLKAAKWLADFLEKYPDEKAAIKEEEEKSSSEDEDMEGGNSSEDGEDGKDASGSSGSPSQKECEQDEQASNSKSPKGSKSSDAEDGKASPGSSKKSGKNSAENSEKSGPATTGEGSEKEGMAESDMPDADLELPDFLNDLEESHKAQKDPSALKDAVEANPSAEKEEKAETPSKGRLDSVRAGKVLKGSRGDAVEAEFISYLQPLSKEEEEKVSGAMKQLKHMLGEKDVAFFSADNAEMGVDMMQYSRLRKGIRAKEIWTDAKTQKRRKGEKTVHLLFDCSGSMSRHCTSEDASAARVGVWLMVALNRLSRQGHIKGSIILSGWVGGDSAAVRYELPMTEETLLKVHPNMSHEGLQYSLEAYMSDLKKDTNAQIVVYTDAHITDMPLNKNWLQVNKLKPWGVYVGEVKDNARAEMEKHFHNRHIIMPKMKDVLTILVKRLTR